MNREKFSEAYDKVRAGYFKQDNCMYDYLAARCVPQGMSFEQATEAYTHLMHEESDDEFFRFNVEEGWKEDMVHGDRTDLNGGLIGNGLMKENQKIYVIDINDIPKEWGKHEYELTDEEFKEVAGTRHYDMIADFIYECNSDKSFDLSNKTHRMRLI